MACNRAPWHCSRSADGPRPQRVEPEEDLGQLRACQTGAVAATVDRSRSVRGSVKMRSGVQWRSGRGGGGVQQHTPRGRRKRLRSIRVKGGNGGGDLVGVRRGRLIQSGSTARSRGKTREEEPACAAYLLSREACPCCQLVRFHAFYFAFTHYRRNRGVVITRRPAVEPRAGEHSPVRDVAFVLVGERDREEAAV